MKIRLCTGCLTSLLEWSTRCVETCFYLLLSYFELPTSHNRIFLFLTVLMCDLAVRLRKRSCNPLLQRTKAVEADVLHPAARAKKTPTKRKHHQWLTISWWVVDIPIPRVNNLWPCGRMRPSIKILRPCTCIKISYGGRALTNTVYYIRVLRRKTSKQTCWSKRGSVCGSRREAMQKIKISSTHWRL